MSACSSFHPSGLLSRRSMLRAGSLGMLGITLPKLLQASSQYTGPKPPVRAKSVIFLFQWGGPSHLETFDMKPEADENCRGPHKPMRSASPDIEVNDRLPKTAAVMDKVTLIKSVHHKMTNHNSAGYYALTGKAPPSHPDTETTIPELKARIATVVAYRAIQAHLAIHHITTNALVVPDPLCF